MPVKAQDVEHGPDGKFRPASLRTIIARAVLAVLEKPDGVETLDWQIADAVLAAQADAPDDDDNTMRDDRMFNRGVQHVVDMLAKTLAPLEAWYAGDGSEDYDCDLEETLRNILAAKGLYDKETGEFAQADASGDLTADTVATHRDGAARRYASRSDGEPE